MNREVFSPELASSLNNLSNGLSDLGRREEALVASKEAVEIYKTLAKTNSAVFNPDLAKSLNNLSNRLSDLGRREEALVAIEEAVEIRRALANMNSKAFNPDLASSLNNLCLWLSALGRRKEALAATIEDSVTIYRCLFCQTPAYFRPRLTLSNPVLKRLGGWRKLI